VTPRRGTNTKGREVLSGDFLYEDSLRIVARDNRLTGRMRGERRVALLLPTEERELRVRPWCVAAKLPRLHDINETPWLGEGERAKEQRVDRRVNRGVRADAD